MSLPLVVTCPHCHGSVPLIAAQPLTVRQREIVTYLREYSDAHGYMPSFDEIALRFGYLSLATVHEHLTNLERKGHIRRTYNESRAIVLMEPREATP